ncbi:MAG: LL-diaminopimelate aminotransferase [Oscillospiraceae bacterium]|jgi:LL-diaminopimelate aminotransferase|nr:LL-diaminopimelate aminotransferase [Oscillospiraceae bacterium]
MKLNKNFLKFSDDYFFYKISCKIKDFIAENKEKKVISLGIGDTTMPLCEAVISAMNNSICEMSKKETYRGYGPEQGYKFLRLKIKNYYKEKGINLNEDEIFIGDGAGRDIGDIQEIFSEDNIVLIVDPTYPAYIDSSILSGKKIVFLNGRKENFFLPMPNNDIKSDIIYLCSPNNPTGSVYTYENLEKWVKYAKNQGSIILFDAAYEAFINSENLPRSIFEIKDAKECAIEIGSFSKTAGFTGVRCGYTVIADDLIFEGCQVNKLWMRRQTTKSNGVSYITQRGAEAIFSKEGQKQIKKNIFYYKENTKLISNSLNEKGIWNCGSENSPYVWAKCPNDMDSWDFFNLLLTNLAIVAIPGSGFGSNGDFYIRFSGFNSKENTLEAVDRIKNLSLI